LDTSDDSTVGGSTIASDVSGGMTYLFREAARLNVSAAATDIDGTQIGTPVDPDFDEEEIVDDFDEENRANNV
jgi:dihydrodipicolinate synthase/N-acetylneuraminate lyase